MGRDPHCNHYQHSLDHPGSNADIFVPQAEGGGSIADCSLLSYSRPLLGIVVTRRRKKITELW